ncbi:MAG: hypothetical protein FWE09_01295 [Treponema sp.]|nr:hypothetical protein [Treponema sp.]
MKKKLALALTLATFVSAGAAFASPVHPGGLGIGALWGGTINNNDFHNNVALSLKLPGIPIFWGATVNFGEAFGIGLQGDYYFLGGPIVPTLSWFLGFGGYADIRLGDNASIGFGGRLPIGLTWQPISLLEVFLNAAPRLGARIQTGSGGGFHFPSGGFFLFEAGLRIWI